MSSRPAESFGIAAAAAFLIARILGLTDPMTVTAIGVVVGCIPAAVTWIVHLRRKPPVK
jgi:NhaP-type Na+/H+ or K+/H+ antiporter